MQTRQLGNSDMQFTEIGLGAWAIGGGGYDFGWGEQDDKQSIDTINRALELGVNWIDTAAIYGLGHSEEVVGRAMKGRRDDAYIATKCSMVWDDNGNISNNLKAESVRRECENSLRRLDIETIDLYQIHWPNDEEHIEEGWAEIQKLIEEGKVRYGGVSNFQVEHLERAQKIGQVTSLQPPYSMLRRGIEYSQMEWCRKHHCGIVAYSPMVSGLLTGKWGQKNIDDEDWRNKSAEHNKPNVDINLWFVDQLRPIAEKYDKDVAQLAIAWTLRRPEVTSAIAGARKPSQIEDNAGATGWTIDEQDQQTIEDLLEERKRKIKEVGGHLPDYEK